MGDKYGGSNYGSYGGSGGGGGEYANRQALIWTSSRVTVSSSRGKSIHGMTGNVATGGFSPDLISWPAQLDITRGIAIQLVGHACT